MKPQQLKFLNYNAIGNEILSQHKEIIAHTNNNSINPRNNTYEK